MCQEQVEKALQQSGKRITQQRKILLDVILNGEWECCKEIYYEAVKRDSSIGMATVYFRHKTQTGKDSTPGSSCYGSGCK